MESENSWIINAVAFEANKGVITEVLALPGIARAQLNDPAPALPPSGNT